MSQRVERKRLRNAEKKIGALSVRRLSLSLERKEKNSNFTLKGALLLKVLRGISPFSSSSGTFWRTT